MKKILTLALLLSLKSWATDTFNAIETNKKYGTEITNIPVDFEQEEIDPDEALIYNNGHEQEVMDEYDLPAPEEIPEDQQIVDIDRIEEPKKDIIPIKSPVSSKHPASNLENK